MNKTPNYTKNAVNKYNSKFDRIAVNLPKGTKEEIRQLTEKSCNAFISSLVIGELERIKSKKEKLKRKKYIILKIKSHLPTCKSCRSFWIKEKQMLSGKSGSITENLRK